MKELQGIEIKWLRENDWALWKSNLLLPIHATVSNVNLWRKQLMLTDTISCSVRHCLCLTSQSPWLWFSVTTWHLLETGDCWLSRCFASVVSTDSLFHMRWWLGTLCHYSVHHLYKGFARYSQHNANSGVFCRFREWLKRQVSALKEASVGD